jgi:hypothetical protein
MVINRRANTGMVSLAQQISRKKEIFRKQKRPAHPGLNCRSGWPQNSSVHFRLRWNGLRPLVWPQIMLEAVSMMGEAGSYYGPRNITRGKSVKTSSDGISRRI